MKFLESKTIQGATSPAFICRWVLGIGTIEYPIGHPRPMISLWWSMANMIIILYFGYRTHYLSRIMQSRTIGYTHAVFHIIVFWSTIFIIGIIILSRINSKNPRHQMRLITKINEDFKRLEITEDYGLTLKSQLFGLIGYIVLFLIHVTSCISTAMRSASKINSEEFSYWILTHHGLIFTTVIDYSFSGMIRYICNRLKHLNEYLIQSTFNENNSKRFFEDLDQSYIALSRIRRNIRLVDVGKQQWMVHVLQEARELRRSLCKIAKKLNDDFSIPILISMIISFSLIVTVLLSMYNDHISTTQSESVHRMIWKSSWVIMYLIRIFSIVHSCSKTTYEAGRMGQLIHEIITPTSSQAIREEIQSFSLELQQTPLELTVNGFFTLDYKWICQMTGSVTTYLVIMMELQSGFVKGSKNDVLVVNATA